MFTPVPRVLLAPKLWAWLRTEPTRVRLAASWGAWTMQVRTRKCACVGGGLLTIGIIRVSFESAGRRPRNRVPALPRWNRSRRHGEFRDGERALRPGPSRELLAARQYGGRQGDC